MSQMKERGANSERNSALWGTGGRGGDRSSVLWGKGGRGILVATVVVALAAPLAATASKAKRPSAHAASATTQLAPAKKAKHAPAKAAKKAKITKVEKTSKAKTTVTKTKVTKTTRATAPSTTPASSTPATPSAPAPVSTPQAPAAIPVPQGADANVPSGDTYVAPALIAKAEDTPDVRVPVIISSSGGTDAAKEAVAWLAELAASTNQASDLQNIDLQSLDLVGGVSLSVPARWLDDLRKVPGLIVTPDSLVKVSGLVNYQSNQLWPYESGNSALWLGDQAYYSTKTPAIAIIDSGVQKRSDFGTRVIASVNLSTIPGNTSLEDERGHGTFVAGVAAGASPDLTGAAPTAPIVSIKVMDKNGQAKTSDVIKACQWILDNKAKYNIRVANFSLHSAYGTNFYRDPLDQAVEKLWFNNVVVVAAAGNYGTADGPSGVKYSPGNDPFVITVGAVDLGGSFRVGDDSVAPFSAYGYTYDGFYKPEIAAPGRYMVGPIPPTGTITGLKPQNMVGKDRIQLSGTSFAAPVVAGTVAQMLARNPSWTPDQVKGALMRTARKVPNNPKAAGVGEVTVTRAVSTGYTPNPNKGLEKYLSSDLITGLTNFDATGWAAKARSDMSWNSMSWADQSWSDMSWADQSWASMSWADQSWSDMSWADMSWADMSWADVSQEDAAEGDAASGEDGYESTPSDAAAATSDPDLAVPVDPAIPASLLPDGAVPAPTSLLP
jgi:serine protease AprX